MAYVSASPRNLDSISRGGLSAPPPDQNGISPYFRDFDFGNLLNQWTNKETPPRINSPSPVTSPVESKASFSNRWNGSNGQNATSDNWKSRAFPLSTKRDMNNDAGRNQYHKSIATYFTQTPLPKSNFDHRRTPRSDPDDVEASRQNGHPRHSQVPPSSLQSNSFSRFELSRPPVPKLPHDNYRPVQSVQLATQSPGNFRSDGNYSKPTQSLEKLDSRDFTSQESVNYPFSKSRQGGSMYEKTWTIPENKPLDLNQSQMSFQSSQTITEDFNGNELRKENGDKFELSQTPHYARTSYSTNIDNASSDGKGGSVYRVPSTPTLEDFFRRDKFDFQIKRSNMSIPTAVANEVSSVHNGVPGTDRNSFEVLKTEGRPIQKATSVGNNIMNGKAQNETQRHANIVRNPTQNSRSDPLKSNAQLKTSKLIEELEKIQSGTPFTNQRWFQIETLKLALVNSKHYPEYYKTELEKHASELCRRHEV